jgi:hypothetical protein
MTLRTGSTLAGRVTIDGGASGGRIVAVDPVTGDTITANDLTADNTYALRLPGGDPIKIRYYLWGAARSSGGWYDNVTEMAQARSVSVPQSGTRTFNFSIR